MQVTTALGIAVILVSASAQAQEHCTKNSECGKGLVCYDGTEVTTGTCTKPEVVKKIEASDREMMRFGKHDCPEARIQGEVVQKMNNHFYEIVELGEWGRGLGESGHALLHTSKTTFSSGGRFAICVNPKFTKKTVTTDSGFSERWRVYTESRPTVARDH